MIIFSLMALTMKGKGVGKFSKFGMLSSVFHVSILDQLLDANSKGANLSASTQHLCLF